MIDFSEEEEILRVCTCEISFDKSSVFESYADLVTVIIMFKLRETFAFAFS